METFLLSLPTTIYGWMALIAFGFFTIVQLILLIRRNDIRTLNESNDILQESLEIKGRKIEEQSLKIEELETKVLLLTQRMVELEASNKSLEDLFMKAVVTYFEDNPEIAKELKKKLAKKVV